MRLSIRLLGMSMKDLNEYIESAVEANPFLRKEFDKKRSEIYKSNFSTARDYSTGMDSNEKSEDPRLSLLSQLRMLGLNDKSLQIAEYLIYEMDDNGYITVALEDVANELSLPIEEVWECLTVIQSLDPPGIGARDIRECLQLQLKRIHKEDSVEYIIVSDFINEIARNDVTMISKALELEKRDVQAAISNIKRLNPRPASTMLSKGSETVIPDLIATIKNKKIRLDLNRDWLPRLKLFNPYENESDVMQDLETRKFVKENMDSAKQLIDNIKRREETMCKVADYILNFHKGKLIDDIDEIETLTIKDISGALNLHPSTINRTVASKYVQIDNKVMLLKSLLSHGIKKENGEITSKINVKKKIEALIKGEDKKQPLSDKAIEEKLVAEGIIIKRRTIAKYRKTLRILPTYLRKKF